MASNGTPSKRPNVVVVGGGVAGLTVAHELIERDFDVVVYERRGRLGGKAASVGVRPVLPKELDRWEEVDEPKDDEVLRPGEHGFRFFPAWYRHLPDTMGRIPVRGRRDWAGEHTVADHLVDVQQNLLLQYNRAPLPIVLHAPKAPSQAQTAVSFVRELSAMGLPLDDIVWFMERLATYLRVPEHERARTYDAVSWWDFVEADKRSEAFRAITVATTRTLLAAKPKSASAHTIALLALRTLFDSPWKNDRVLDGPTSDVWINPWVEYLQGRGVTFERDFELDSIQFAGHGPKISSLRFIRSSDVAHMRRLRAIPAMTDSNRAKTELGDLLRWRRERGRALTDEETELEDRALAPDAKIEELHDKVSERLASFGPEWKEDVTADYYVFALPVEQMAYYVNRSETLKSYAPSLRNVVRLSSSVDWMSGIQFYFRYPPRMPPGHIVFGDSEWALTAIEQTQFWKHIPLPAGVRSVLSVDVSAWDRPGRVNRRAAFLCTRAEIAREVWEQLKASANRGGEQEVLRDDALVTGEVAGSYHVDDDIIERFDRKKQGAFVQGLVRAADRVAETTLSAEELLQQTVGNLDAPFIFGDRLDMNVEPLLVNRAGTLALRPKARTPIANMYLAGDYVDTSTNLACMEGANESARHAANAILEASGSKYAPCKTWRLDTGEVLGKLAVAFAMFDGSHPGRAAVGAATGAAATLAALASRATQTAKLLWKKAADDK